MWIKRNSSKPHQFNSLIHLKYAKPQIKQNTADNFCLPALLVLRGAFLETLKSLQIQKTILTLKPGKTHELGQLQQRKEVHQF